MKIKYLALILAITSSVNVFAADSKATQQLSVPFVNKAVNGPDYSGLTFSYNMNGSTALQKVVCTFSNFYKGWMDYADGLAWNTTGTYGGSQTVILTSKGQSVTITESLDQFHADAKSTATVHHIDNNKSPAFVSCFYMPEDNNKVK